MKLQRRASRGHTHDPWPCCGRVPASSYGRRKEGICEDCAALIVAGRAAIEALPADVTPHWWTERAYAWPQWYGWTWARSNDQHRALGEAFHALVASVTIVAPHTTPAHTDKLKPKESYQEEWARTYVPWPDLIEFNKRGSNDRFEFRRLVLCTAPVRAALNRLYLAIGDALEQGHADAKDAGLSIVRRLAAGDVTINDFNEAALEVREPRRRR